MYVFGVGAGLDVQVPILDCLWMYSDGNSIVVKYLLIYYDIFVYI